jgi:hypothetical protein
MADVTPYNLDVSKTPVRMRELSSSSTAAVPAYTQSLLQRPPAMLKAGPPLKVPTFEMNDGAPRHIIQLSRYSPEPGHKSPPRASVGLTRSPKGPSSRPSSQSPSPPPPRRDGGGGVHRVVASYDMNTSCMGSPAKAAIPDGGALLDTMDKVLRISQEVP